MCKYASFIGLNILLYICYIVKKIDVSETRRTLSVQILKLGSNRLTQHKYGSIYSQESHPTQHKYGSIYSQESHPYLI